MSTVSEIEAALPLLSLDDLRRVAAAVQDLQVQRTSPLAPKLAEAPARYHDLDFLIGTWQEDLAFDAAIRTFEQVDEDAWK